MQKKYLLILGLLLIFITGCKISPFNVKAEVNYVSQEVKGDTTAAKKIEITVSLGNSVYIDSIKEVNATVNGTAVKLKFDNNEINDTNKKIVIYAFVKADGTTIVPLTTNVIQITSINMEDENENEITMKGNVTEVKIGESGSSTGETTAVPAVTDLFAVVAPENSVKLTWKASTVASKYIVYRYVGTGENPIFNPDQEVAVITAPEVVTTSLAEYTDKNLTVGNTYFYRVVAYKSATEISAKQTVPASVRLQYTETSLAEVPQVAGLQAEPDVDSVLLNWTALTTTDPEIVGYNIYAVTGLGTSSEKTYILNKPTPHITMGNKFTIYKGDEFISGSDKLTAASGVDMFIKVAAVARDGREGKKSLATRVYMYDSNVIVLQASTDIKVVPYGNDFTDQTKLGVRIEWNLKSGIGKYVIERSEDGMSYSEIQTVTAAYTAGGKANIIDGSFMEIKNKKAYYRIRCVSTTGAVGRPSGALTVEDYSNMLIPDITTQANMLLLSNLTTVGTSSTYVFQYVELNDDGSIKGGAKVTGLPLDFAGYKMYMSNSFDGEFKYVGKVSGLWGAELNIENTIIDPTKPIYVRCSTYDYFGNESALSLRTDDLK